MSSTSEPTVPRAASAVVDAPAPAGSMLGALVRLARPQQWAKGVFVLIGPAYGVLLNPVPGRAIDPAVAAWGVAGAFLAFAFASSFCYVVNDLYDRDVDRAHPRKRHRPIASGRVGVGAAMAYAAVLLAMAVGAVFLVPNLQVQGLSVRVLLGVVLLAYVANTVLYSMLTKHRVVLDVISLSCGFVLRVLGGCAAAGVEPSSWLLNVTFFAAMFLALGKRLGERRTLGQAAALARGVHAKYTDDLLRMAVVVTGVACLLTYGSYVQAQAGRFTFGFNLLWITMLPATYGLLRCMVLLERGVYDDPTEIGVKDRPTQAAAIAFGAITGALVLAHMRGWVG